MVGIVAATMATEYHANLNNAIQARAEELGFSAEIFDSQEDPNRQLQGIEGFISAGADAIIVTGLGGESIGPAAAEATSAGHLRRPGRRPRPHRVRRRDDQRRGGGHRHRRGHRRRRVRRGELPRRWDPDGDHRLPDDRVARGPSRHDRGVVHGGRTPTPSSSRASSAAPPRTASRRWRRRCRRTPTSSACSASTTPATSAPTRRWRTPGADPTTCSSSASTATRRRSS